MSLALWGMLDAPQLETPFTEAIMGHAKPGYGPMPAPGKSTKRSRARAAKRAEQWAAVSGPAQSRVGTSGPSHGRATEQHYQSGTMTKGVIEFYWPGSAGDWREGKGQ